MHLALSMPLGVAPDGCPCARGCFWEAADAELCVDVLEVLVQGAPRDAHLGDGLRWGAAKREKSQGLGLAGGESKAMQRRCVQLARGSFDQQYSVAILAIGRE